MGLFGFGKKKEEHTIDCDCGGNCNISGTNTDAIKKNDTGFSIKVLGSGCKKCNELESNVKLALTKLNIDAVIEHVEDFSQIASYGVMSTPALVVNEKVISYGKVLKTDEVIKLFQEI